MSLINIKIKDGVFASIFNHVNLCSDGAKECGNLRRYYQSCWLFNDPLNKAGKDYIKCYQCKEKWKKAKEEEKEELFNKTGYPDTAEPRVSIHTESADERQYRFDTTYCSQCGGKFGPGNSGYSHCEDHKQQ